MLQNYSPILILFLIIFPIIIPSASASSVNNWTVSLPLHRSALSETELGGTGLMTVSVVAQSSFFEFSNTLQSDTSVFPGSCVSNKNNEPFGWNKYKHEMIFSMSVTVDLHVIFLVLWPRIGYSLISAETVTCKIPSSYVVNYHNFNNKNKNDTSDDDDGLSFSFDIVPAAATALRLYSVIDIQTPQFIPVAIPDLETAPPPYKQLDEDTVLYGQAGLKFYLVLSNGAWNSSSGFLINSILMKSISCSWVVASRKDILDEKNGKIEYTTTTMMNGEENETSSLLSCSKMFNLTITPSAFKILPDIPNVVEFYIPSKNLSESNFGIPKIGDAAEYEFSMLLLKVQLPNNGKGAEAGFSDSEIQQPIIVNSFYIVGSPETTTTTTATIMTESSSTSSSSTSTTIPSSTTMSTAPAETTSTLTTTTTTTTPSPVNQPSTASSKKKSLLVGILVGLPCCLIFFCVGYKIIKSKHQHRFREQLVEEEKSMTLQAMMTDSILQQQQEEHFYFFNNSNNNPSRNNSRKNGNDESHTYSYDRVSRGGGVLNEEGDFLDSRNLSTLLENVDDHDDHDIDGVERVEMPLSPI